MDAQALRERIQHADDIPVEPVEVPEWEPFIDGEQLYVQGLTAEGRDSYEASCLAGEGRERDVDLSNIRAKLVVRCVVDEDGDRVFSNEDAGWVGEKSGRAIDRIFGVAQRLSGLSDEDVEELAGN